MRKIHLFLGIIINIVFLNSCMEQNYPYTNNFVERDINPIWTFVVTGDSRGPDEGINGLIVPEIVNAITNEADVELVLFVGDEIQGYTDYDETVYQLSNWKAQFMDPIESRGITVYPLRGNHECIDGYAGDYYEGVKAWNEVIGQYLPQNGPTEEKGVTYSVTTNDTLFLLLDTYKIHHTPNQEWINAELSNSTATHVFALAHEPIYAMGGFGHQNCIGTNADIRNELVYSLISNNSVAFFAGHDHWYDHSQANFSGTDFHQYIIGTAGAPLRDWDEDKHGYIEDFVENITHDKSFGYAVIDVFTNGFDLTMKRRSGGEYVVFEKYSHVYGE